MGQNEASTLKTISAYSASRARGIHEGNGATAILPERAMMTLRPRATQLAALELGLPNKLIAVKLKLSKIP